MAVLRLLGRKFGSEMVEGGRSGLLDDGEDGGSVDGIEPVARFRLTSTL